MICSDFIYTLAIFDENLQAFICNTKLSESSDMTKHWVIYYHPRALILFYKKVLRN